MGRLDERAGLRQSHLRTDRHSQPKVTQMFYTYSYEEQAPICKG